MTVSRHESSIHSGVITTRINFSIDTSTTAAHSIVRWCQSRLLKITVAAAVIPVPAAALTAVGARRAYE